MLKIFQSSIFRAICAIVVGALLIKYREETMTGITIAIGVLFFVSGLISTMAYFSAKHSKGSVELFDAQGNPVDRPAPMFPIVGMGSMALGGMLALVPNTFVSGLMYILAAILILGALNQFFNLASALKYTRIGFFWWLFPSVILIIGLIAIIRPTIIASAPLFIIGWTMMVYGVVDLFNAIKIYRSRKAYEKAHAPVAQPSETAAPKAEIENKTAEPAPSGAETEEVMDNDID